MINIQKKRLSLKKMRKNQLECQLNSIPTHILNVTLGKYIQTINSLSQVLNIVFLRTKAEEDVNMDSDEEGDFSKMEMVINNYNLIKVL